MRVAAIQCEGEARCCSAASRSHDACLRDYQQGCVQGLYLDEIVRQPTAAFDPRASERILGELTQRAGRCDPSLLRWAASSQGLRGMFRGTLTADASCNPAGGVTGDPGLIAAALASCRVDEGLACLPTGLLGDWTCAPKQPRGGTCLTDDNCEPTDVCDNFSEPRTGMCVQRLPLGAACENAGQCDSLNCDDGECAGSDAQLVYCPAPRDVS